MPNQDPRTIIGLFRRVKTSGSNSSDGGVAVAARIISSRYLHELERLFETADDRINVLENQLRNAEKRLSLREREIEELHLTVGRYAQLLAAFDSGNDPSKTLTKPSRKLRKNKSSQLN